MAYTLSIGEKAPDFDLVGTDVDYYSLDSFQEYENLIIFFTCNHCPYVTGSDEVTRATVEKFKGPRFKFVAINSNSKNTYEEDSFENMVKRIDDLKFPWLYLYDETQKVAMDYGALKTEGDVSIITLDDGKANVFSYPMLETLQKILSEIPKDKAREICSRLFF